MLSTTWAVGFRSRRASAAFLQLENVAKDRGGVAYPGFSEQVVWLLVVRLVE
jgi:hypothetical protein